VAREILLAFSNPVDGRDDEYNDWYTNQHLDEILAVEGFRTAQRFELVDAKMTNDTPTPPYRYLVLYEIEEGSLERADAALFKLARTERDEARAEGRLPRLVVSSAMDPDLRAWWFRAISDVRQAK
jgi:hypothetical protein